MYAKEFGNRDVYVVGTATIPNQGSRALILSDISGKGNVDLSFFENVFYTFTGF